MLCVLACMPGTLQITRLQTACLPLLLQVKSLSHSRGGTKCTCGWAGDTHLSRTRKFTECPQQGKIAPNEEEEPGPEELSTSLCTRNVLVPGHLGRQAVPGSVTGPSVAASPTSILRENQNHEAKATAELVSSQPLSVQPFPGHQHGPALSSLFPPGSTVPHTQPTCPSPSSSPSL